MKEVKLRDLIIPLAALPYGYFAIRLYEFGFDWITAIMGIILFFIVLPVFIVVSDAL